MNEVSKNIDKQYMVIQGIDEKYANKYYNLNNYYRELSKCRQIIVHCTATDSTAWDDPLTCIRYDLGANHISSNGCPTATYHFYIAKTGNAYQLVSMNLKTWNCSYQNNDSVAVCINHAGTKNNVTPEQYQSLVNCIAYIFDYLDWDYSEESVRERLHFHRDYANKLCPGKLDKTQLQNDVIKKLKTYGDNN
jgi:hypothetical protein